MDAIAAWVAGRLVEAGAQEEKREIYIYAVEGLLSVACMVAGFVLLGLLTGRLGEVALWQVSLLGLRIPMGGYHAPTHTRCQAMSFGMGGLSLLIIPWLPGSASVALGVATMVIAFAVAPVIHVNQPQSRREKRRAKILARLFSVLELAGILALWALDLEMWGAVVATGGICASLSALYAHVFSAVH